MKYAEFAERVVSEYHKQFPNSMCKVGIFSGEMLYIDCYLAGCVEETINHIPMNDMIQLRLHAFVHNFNAKEDDLPDLEMVVGSKCYKIKPSSRMVAYDCRTIPVRKTNGDAEKIIKTLAKCFKSMHDLIAQDLADGNIHQNYASLVEKKLA